MGPKDLMCSSSLAVIPAAQKPAYPTQRCPSSLETITETRAVGHPEPLRRAWWCTRRWSDGGETGPDSPHAPPNGPSIHTVSLAGHRNGQQANHKVPVQPRIGVWRPW